MVIGGNGRMLPQGGSSGRRSGHPWQTCYLSGSTLRLRALCVFRPHPMAPLPEGEGSTNATSWPPMPSVGSVILFARLPTRARSLRPQSRLGTLGVPSWRPWGRTAVRPYSPSPLSAGEGAWLAVAQEPRFGTAAVLRGAAAFAPGIGWGRVPLSSIEGGVEGMALGYPLILGRTLGQGLLWTFFSTGL